MECEKGEQNNGEHKSQEEGNEERIQIGEADSGGGRGMEHRLPIRGGDQEA